MSFLSLDFLLDASTKPMQDLELAARNRAANIAKSLKVEIDDWIEQEATALIVRWMLANRAALLGRPIVAEPHKAELFVDKPSRKAG